MGKVPEKEITISISLIADKMELTGENLAYINGRYLRMIERGIYKAVKNARVTLIREENAAQRQKESDKVAAAAKAYADKEKEANIIADENVEKKMKKQKALLKALQNKQNKQ